MLSVRAAALEAGNEPALIFEDSTWTWSQLASEAEAELAFLLRAGVVPKPARSEQRVAFDAVAEPATIVRIFALLEIGAAFVLLHHGLTQDERARRLKMLRPCLDLDQVSVNTGQAINFESPGADNTPSDEDPTAVLFTSGSSGTPRAVELSRGAFQESAARSASRLGWKEGDRWLCCLPLAHVGGLSILIRCLIARRTIVLVPRFEPAAVVDAIDRNDVTLASLVPSMLTRLLRLEPKWAPSASLRAILLGGSSASEDIWKQAERRGIPILATYGLTETCSQVATARKSAPRDLVPLDGIEIRINKGCIEVGSADGYVRTGDLGRLRPDGVLEVLGRADDLIITGGENVMPAEVEIELESHPQILRAAVFGQPDPDWGEIVVAALVSDGPPPELGALSEWCDEHLASFRRPRRIAWLDSLPETPVGKLDRTAIVEAVAAGGMKHLG